MKQINIITFSGRKGHGKDTAANELQALLAMDGKGRKMRRIAFADPIAEAICKQFKVTIQQYHQLKRSCLTSEDGGLHLDGREIVRGVGMLMRSYDEHQFVRYAQQQLENLVRQMNDDEQGYLLITDTRFQNEIDWLQDVDGIVTHFGDPVMGSVNTHWVPLWVQNSNMSNPDDAHVTESLQREDIRRLHRSVGIIDNSGDRQALRREVAIAMSQARILKPQNTLDRVRCLFTRWEKE